MAWQDMFTGSATHIDAEHEQELRLAAQARLGADWALGALIARYQPTVIRYITRLTGNPARARILGEQIFLRMERRLHGPHGGQHLRLWLLRASTEAGLDELRKPHPSAQKMRLDAPQATALLPDRSDRQSGKQSGRREDGRATASAASGNGSRGDRLRAGLNALADKTGTTRRQLRQLIWSVLPEGETAEAGKVGGTAQRLHATDEQVRKASPRWDEAQPADEEEQLDPREALRYRMIRAVLAELPYGDAQCLALHLIAGLNQAEVARALGITASATRRRIVQGLQLFAQRYEAAVASLGISFDALDHPQDEATEELEAPDVGEAALPSQRGPIVVSARVTAPLDSNALNDEPTVIWDLPPFVNPVPAPAVEVTELAETGETAQGTPVALEDALTRRVVWSRPRISEHPDTSGELGTDTGPSASASISDEVTMRVPRPYVAPETSDVSNGADVTGTINAASANEPLEPEWVEAETIITPPPAEMVVEADPTPRTVPVLTTQDSLDGRPEDARIISVLTTTPSPAEDTPVSSHSVE